MDLAPYRTAVAAAVTATKTEVDRLLAWADAARPDHEPNSWPEADAARSLIQPLNQALANLMDASAAADRLASVLTPSDPAASGSKE